jgi:hypothetical protein
LDDPRRSVKQYWLEDALEDAFDDVPTQLLSPPRINTATQLTCVVPQVIDGRQYVVVAYCSRGGGREGVKQMVYPPFALVRVAYPDKTYQWDEVIPESFELSGLPLDEQNRPYLGVIEQAKDYGPRGRNAIIHLYNQLVSRVLEQEWLVNAHQPIAEEKAVGHELQECIRLLYDKPLMPYYKYVGHGFLLWLAQATR